MAKDAIKFPPESKGITGYIEGKKLVLEIDLTQDHGPSKSGKTTVIATTGPALRIPPDVMVGLNVNRKQKK